jgi:hypothetical protein
MFLPLTQPSVAALLRQVELVVEMAGCDAQAVVPPWSPANKYQLPPSAAEQHQDANYSSLVGFAALLREALLSEEQPEQKG